MPPPPGGPDAQRDPKDAATDLIQRVGDRLKDAPEDDAKAPGHAFLEAAKAFSRLAEQMVGLGPARVYRQELTVH